MNKLSIKAQGLGKQYIIGGAEEQYDSFRDMLSNALASPFRKFRRLSGDVSEQNRFWALQDIDFEINQGDVVGVIGHNGAGKSTLLKVLSRITAPTKGKVEIHGRVASLLEVGTGFHPELTGRENIYLNGSILGMQRSQIDEKFGEIVDFADVGKFLDTPVKRYSSGMYVRLAFSVAAHLDTDVLLVDEVLAVGDQRFQKKCLGKLGDVSSEGRTVIFVSHNLSSVAQLCSKALVLDKGKIIFNGEVNEGISVYNHKIVNSKIFSEQEYLGDLYPKVKFDRLFFDDKPINENTEINPLKETTIRVDGNSTISSAEYQNILSIRKSGLLLFSLCDTQTPNELKPGQFQSTFIIPANLLLPGEYTFSIGGSCSDRSSWLWTRDYRFVVAHRWMPDYDSTSAIAGIINVSQYGSRTLKG